MVVSHICFRRNVHDDEFVHHVGVFEGKLHGRFPAHRMPHDGGPVDPVFLHEISEVIGHARIIMHGIVRRASVVPLVEDENGMFVGQLFGDGLPIVQSAEKAVKDDKRRALPECFISECQGGNGNYKSMKLGN